MRASEVIRILLGNGFVKRKAKGGHRQFVRTEPPPKRLVTVAYHTGDLPKHTLRRIATQSGKRADEFTRLCGDPPQSVFREIAGMVSNCHETLRRRLCSHELPMAAFSLPLHESVP